MTRSFPYMLLLAAAVLALSSCVTAAPPAPKAPPTRAQAESTLRDILASDRPQEAFARLDFYQREGILPQAEADKLRDTASGAVVAAFEKAVSDSQFDRAAGLLTSLDTLKSAGLIKQLPEGNWSVDLLHFKLAEKYRKEGNDPAALDELLRVKDLAKVVPADTLAIYAGMAASHHSRSGAEQIAAALRQLGADVPSEVTSYLSASVNSAAVLKGTVTLFLDQGIKLQQGLGFPDIAIGSGFFIDSRGYLLTNYHVIAGMVEPGSKDYARLYVIQPGKPNEKIPATVVGYSKVFDIALVKADIKPAYLFSLDQTRKVEQGETVYAVGSPGGLDSTLTSGIVSATDRQIMQMGDTLQIDVPVNPGNSGGPLLTGKGELIGVVFAGVQGFQGVNFAIPTYWLRAFLPRLYAGGQVKHPWLGAAVIETGGGLEVTYVAPGSPAAAIGLTEHDLVTSVDGRTVTKITEVQRLLMSLPRGSLVPIEWQHEGSSVKGMVVAADRPENPVEPVIKEEQPTVLFPLLYGMDITPKPAFLRPDYEITRVYPGSPADETGLSPQDLFALVGRQYDPAKKRITYELQLKNQKAGFPNRAIGLTAATEVSNFI
ncbi:S1C family serine protease [Salinispira pacifica]